MYFFFNDTATTEIYTLSLHDALPIYPCRGVIVIEPRGVLLCRAVLHALRELAEQREQLVLLSRLRGGRGRGRRRDRKSTRLNSSHLVISYAVFCLKKKN